MALIGYANARLDQPCLFTLNLKKERIACHGVLRYNKCRVGSLCYDLCCGIDAGGDYTFRVFEVKCRGECAGDVIRCTGDRVDKAPERGIDGICVEPDALPLFDECDLLVRHGYLHLQQVVVDEVYNVGRTCLCRHHGAEYLAFLGGNIEDLALEGCFDYGIVLRHCEGGLCCLILSLCLIVLGAGNAAFIEKGLYALPFGLNSFELCGCLIEIGSGKRCQSLALGDNVAFLHIYIFDLGSQLCAEFGIACGHEYAGELENPVYLSPVNGFGVYEYLQIIGIGALFSSSTASG